MNRRVRVDGRKSTETMTSLRHKIIGDSIDRKKWLDKLIKMVREEERRHSGEQQ